MSKYNVRMDSYFSDMRAMASQVSQIVDGQRKVKSDSTAVHEVTVSGDGKSITLYLSENQFYMLGFKGANDKVNKFADKEIVGQAGAKSLGIGCNYTGTQSIGILNDGSTEKGTQRSRKNIVSAISALSSFNGDNSNDIKVSLGLIVYYICESLRFAKIFGRMVSISKGEGYFTFEEYKDLVQNWSKISSGANPTGTTKADVYILQA